MGWPRICIVKLEPMVSVKLVNDLLTMCTVHVTRFITLHQVA